MAATVLLGREARFRLPQEPDDLRFGESLLHVRSPLRVIGLYTGVLLKKGFINLPDAGRVVDQDPNLGGCSRNTRHTFHSTNARVRSVR